MLKIPKAYIEAGTVKKTKVQARIDMSEEVAGAGLCPDCHHPMDTVFIATAAGDVECYVCHPDRIAIPTPDKA